MQTPERFFSALVDAALENTRNAPDLEGVIPLVGRGWRLRFQLADDMVEVNAIASSGPAAGMEYSYVPPVHASAKRVQHLQRVGQVLCRLLEQAPLEGEPPAAPEHDDSRVDPDPDIETRESLSIWLPGDCDRGCIFCSVSVELAAAEKRSDRRVALPVMGGLTVDELDSNRTQLEQRLRAHAHRASEIAIEWSGKDCLASPNFDSGLRLAHELGYREMSVQTPGSRLLEPGFIDFLRRHSVDQVALTAHAGEEAVFDDVGGKRGAYQIFWKAFRSLLEDGSFRVQLEVPCVAKTVDGLPEHLAELVSYGCPITCFYWYPSEDMNHTFPEIGMPFSRAIDALERARNLVPPLSVAIDGIPECVVPEALADHYTWNYAGGHTSFINHERLPVCADCAARERCPGAAPVYSMHHPDWPGTPLRSSRSQVSG